MLAPLRGLPAGMEGVMSRKAKSRTDQLRWDIGCQRMICGFYAGVISDLELRGYDHVSMVGHTLRMIKLQIDEELAEMERQLATDRRRK
jgi:hypothetical protein